MGLIFLKMLLENFKLNILSMKNGTANIKHPGNYYEVLLNINILSYLFQVSFSF